MIFYTPNGLIRPVRLSEKTRQFAYDSLNHKYGIETRKNSAVSLDEIDIKEYEKMPPLLRYDLAILKIAKEAPIRICEGERISGAATLGLAIDHQVPATYGGVKIFRSVSRLTVDFETVVKKGINHIRRQAEISLKKHRGSEKEPFLKSCMHCLNCFDIWHKRYLDALSDRPEYRVNYENLKRVPMEPAETFYEAVQSIWFTFAFLRLCGNWPGIGRIDLLLGDYLKNDLQKGILTLDEAREILAHFFIKGCEWIVGGEYVGGGDAQHYQNILLSGVDENGNDVTNEVTYLVLDILEELGISDFPTTVRLNKNTDEKLLLRVAEVMRYGGGILAVYNEDKVIEAMKKDGYSHAEASRFANDGCWEVQVPGKTFFMYLPFDSLHILQKNTLNDYGADIDYPTFESLYQQYIVDLKLAVEKLVQVRVEKCNTRNEKGEWEWEALTPCTVVSLFERGCIENGRSYFEGGPIYNIVSPHIGGLADTVNSLYAIKKLVYEEKKITLPAFFRILKNDWEGEEALRQYVMTHYSYYGNDNDEVDLLCARLIDDFADICETLNGKCGYRFPAGVSTFGRQLEWIPQRTSSPHGRKRGEILAGNSSPTPGTDCEGATAIIQSYCKSDLSRMTTGAALDLKLLPSAVEGENGLLALTALMRGFVALGGFFMQLDIADASVLRDAQAHPETYQNLSVRVSGWNARFVTLSREWQNMIIEQTER